MEYAYGHGDRPLTGYTIMRAVGRGAFGEVYFAVSDGGREVALKRLVDNAEIELRGVKRCINIKNPHLVSVFDIMTGDDGRPYIVMEYVAGPSLRDLLTENPSGLGEEKTRFLFQGMMSALACLHGQSIVHRDLKPENIFLDEGYIKIGDYGLAKHISISQAGRQTINLGTVHYMAPEIATGVYDHRVDVYALGVLLFEMLTGEAPFLGKDMYEIALQHVSAKPDTKKLSKKFRSIVAKAMAKDPKERYGSVQEMGADMGLPTVTARAAPPPPALAPGAEGTPAESEEAPRASRRKRGRGGSVGIFSGEGWLGRIGMTLIAAMAMALALSIAPEDVGQSFRSLLRLPPVDPTPARSVWSFIGAEFLPTLVTLFVGSLLTGGISLWFNNRVRSHGGSTAACRLLVASLMTVVCGAAFFFGPYLGMNETMSQLRFDVGLARLLERSHFQQMLFVVFLGVALINWCKAASPDRRTRISLGQAIVAAFFGWVIAVLMQFPGMLPAGLMAGRGYSGKN